MDILLADDSESFRRMIKTMLAKHEDLQIIAEASNGKNAIAQAENYTFDIILMDVLMPELNGIDATRHICRYYPKNKILAITAYEDDFYLSRMIMAGAKGYLIKPFNKSTLIEAIRTTAEGKRYPSI